MTPLFSVVIPLYNKEKYISETLKSVVLQSFKDFEIVLVNDGSTDNSLQIAKTCLKEHKNHTIISKKNKGLSAARNTGIAASKGKIITLLDADDLWKPTYLEHLNTLHKLYPDILFFGTDYAEVYSKTKTLHTSKNIPKHFKNNSLIIDDFFKTIMQFNIITPSSFAFKASVFKTFKFNESITFSEDIDFYLQCLTTHKLAYYYSPLVLKRNDIPNQLTQLGIVEKTITNLNTYEPKNSKNTILKRFLDTKRYHYATQYKLAKKTEEKQAMLAHLNYNNLTLKQRLLLKSPYVIHKALVQFKTYLLKHNIRLTSY